MQVALIALGDPAGEGAGDCTLAGRALAAHQLDFAIALGCEKIIVFGHGASPQAIALRHAGEKAGAQVLVVQRVRDLPATIRGDDQLLVLAHGLLPDSASAFALLKDGPGILVLPADAGWSAGFERLDLSAAWGGAMVIPGRLVAGLDELPEDAEPVAGLLRLARQAGVPERSLPVSELADGRWQIVRTAEASEAVAPAWMKRRLPPVSPFKPTVWLARTVLKRAGSRWVGNRRVKLGLDIGAVVLTIGAMAAAWFDLPVVAFSALVPGALLIEAGDGLRLIAKSAFATETRSSRRSFALRVLWDAAFVVIGAVAIDSSRAHRLFEPLVAVGLLRIPPRWPEVTWPAVANDRAILAALLALCAAFGFTEGGFMLLSLLLITARFAAFSGKRG